MEAHLEQVEELSQWAMSMGYTICPLQSIAHAIGRAIASRVRTREGNALYQTASFSISAISRQAALQLFTSELMQDNQTSRLAHATWVASTVQEVRKLVEPIMIKSGYVCAGATRALKTKSERWSRVVAHIIPHLRICHVATRDQLQVDFQYILLDEAGEIHPPKDGNRIEMRLSPIVVSEARAQIRVDLLELVEKRLIHLSPKFLRQLGLQQEAMRLEAESSQLRLQHQAQGRGSRVPCWEVSCIVDERGSNEHKEYLVQWAGYHPSWEVWRVNGPGGEVGSPLLTWEPANALKQTVALQEWLDRDKAAVI